MVLIMQLGMRFEKNMLAELEEYWHWKCAFMLLCGNTEAIKRKVKLLQKSKPLILGCKGTLGDFALQIIKCNIHWKRVILQGNATLGKYEILQNRTLICWGTTFFVFMDMRKCLFLRWGWKCRDTHRIIEGIYTWGILYVAKHQQLSHHKQSFSFSHLFYYLHKTTRAPPLQTGSMYLLSNWKRNLSDQFL